MAKAYSVDMRQRVIGRVESGASRRDPRREGGTFQALFQRR
jgi:hypothetical protein